MTRSKEMIPEDELLEIELINKLVEIGIDREKAEWGSLISICNWYADKKMELMFKQQEDKNKGMVKTRGDGVGFISQEEFFKKVN